METKKKKKKKKNNLNSNNKNSFSNSSKVDKKKKKNSVSQKKSSGSNIENNNKKSLNKGKNSKTATSKKVNYNKKRKKKKNINNNSNNKFSLIEVTIFIFISIVFGIIVGYLVTYTNSSLNKIRSDTALKELVDTYVDIKNNYYGEVNDKKLSEAAIKGMIEYLDDPYTKYLDGSSSEKFNDSVSGTYVGIGVTISFENEYNKIIDVYSGGPADVAGLEVGDIILEINDVDCHNVYGEDLNNLVDKEVGTKVRLKVKRNDKEKKFVVTNEVIDVTNVSSELMKVDKKNVGYIKINIFASNIFKQFESNLKDLEKKKLDYLIIDLRNNPGGQLAQTNNILNLFFKRNTVLYKIDNGKKIIKVKDSTFESRDVPVILMTSYTTASSSEVFVSAFKENYKNVTIIGEETYGKGTVQRTQSLLSGTSIKYTTDRWLTSKGESIDKKGIVPDYAVTLSPTYYDDPVIDNDNQLQFALDKIKES